MKPLIILVASLAIVGMLLFASGCVSPAGNQTAGPTPAPTLTPTGTAPSTTVAGNETPARTPGVIPGTGAPRVTILSPVPYSAVTTTDVTIEVLVRNFTPGGEPAAGNTGNIIYYMDLIPLAAPGVQANMTLSGEEGIFAVSTNTSHTFSNVRPGIHNFSVVLVHPDNTPFDPPALDVAEVIAVGPDATPPPTPVPSVVLTPGPVTALPSVQPLNATPTGTGTPSATETTAAGTPSATGTTAGTPAATGTAGTNVTTGATTAAGGQATTVDLTAQNIAFDKSTITVPAGAQVTVNFNNQDNGVPHNFAVYTDSSASQNIFRGDTVTGPATTTYTFTAPSEPGTYFFRCDVHPEAMTGDFVVQ